MNKRFHLQYEDVASSVDWRTEAPKLDPKFMAISADSHVTEPPEAYTRYLDPKFHNVAPRVIKNPDPNIHNELYVFDGMDGFPFHTAAAAGMRPNQIDKDRGGFDSMHVGGWDAAERIKAQDRDGILAEVLYPSYGLLLCGHPDPDYKHACFASYNQWMRDFIRENSRRLIGVGQSTVRSVTDAIDDVHKIKELGLGGIMLPSEPSCDLDYDHKDFDALWRVIVELKMPVSFHILTGRGPIKIEKPPRGGKLAGYGGIVRELQDIANVFVFGGIFERHPDLKIILVESDAGWVPHFCSRMDHAYKRHRFWLKTGSLSMLPSEFFFANVYNTFQDDWVALQSLHLLNPQRLLWANDYPHTDSTWPWSHELLAHHTAHMTDQHVGWILRDNVRELYGAHVGA
jgi:predicted TIM-barrel fold metal-dependent hydrolase